MKVLKNAKQVLTLQKSYQKDGRNLNPEDLDIIENASIVYSDKILWVGRDEELPQEYKNAQVIDASSVCITPEIIDSHTHLVFGGNRADEYAMKINGTPYEEIAKRGGGILATMDPTNQASEESLFQEGKKRVERLASYGITTIEIKSGYSLTFKGEYKLSKVIKKLKDHFSPKIRIFNTFLAAHAIPQNSKNSSEFLEKIVFPLLEKLSEEKIIDIVDIFHEKGYFTKKDTENLFNKAKDLDIPTKIHADEFNDNGGAQIAHRYKSLSADHLLKVSDENIKLLGKSQTIASLLPGTSLFLGKDLAPARKILDAGAKVALASDYNPGSCHCDNLLLLASIAAPLYKMNLTELWTAITLNAAHSLGVKDSGVISAGFSPRFSFFKCEKVSEITYNWGRNLSTNLSQI